MDKHSGLRAALVLGFAALSMGAWAQDEGEEAPAEEDSSGGASANGNDRRFYIAPMFSYTMADDDRATKDAMGGVLSVGKKMTSGLNLELTAFYEQMDAEAAGADSATLTGYGVAAMIFPWSSWPRVFGLLALHHSDASDHPTTPAAGIDYDGTVFDSGLGYLLPLNDLVGWDGALRAEVRYRMDSHHSHVAGVGGKDEFYEPVFNIGVLIPFGGGPEEPAAAKPGDADGDGVTDDADQCPDTPAGATVNESGCETDADGDGVVDRLDQCPDTPAGTQVDEKGCPMMADADGDGVADSLDQCPDTPAGTKVNASGCTEGCRAPAPGQPIDLEGCATGEAVVLKGVNFEPASSRLTANAKVILNQVADSLAGAPALRVEIGGHTDAQGADAYNQKLSERRAQAVKDYMVSRGIDASRLESKGYGESQPVDTNDTAEGRELNRRVEMKILEGGGQ